MAIFHLLLIHTSEVFTLGVISLPGVSKCAHDVGTTR